MRAAFVSAVLALLLQLTCAASEEKPLKPCTIKSPNTGSFFDLSPLNVTLPETPEDDAEEVEVESWHARGYDYGANFTINICGAVVEKLDDVEGVKDSMWRNVSAFYTKRGRTYSIGQQNDELVIRGRKLVLNYTNGSPCDERSRKRFQTSLPQDSQDLEPNKIKDDDDDKSSSSSGRRKSTIISLLCERDPLASKAALSFVGWDEDECSYFFELRSSHACPSVQVEEQQLGPSGVFGVIALIAILVYLVGGCVYQRAVMHQRGWRQLPNYALWAGIGGFFRDIFIITFSSCVRCLPGRHGYSQMVGSDRGRRRSSSDDENRLIDQLDEEWDD